MTFIMYETNNFQILRCDFGNMLIRNINSSEEVYLQGDDCDTVEIELNNCEAVHNAKPNSRFPLNTLIDNVVGEYFN